MGRERRKREHVLPRFPFICAVQEYAECSRAGAEEVSVFGSKYCAYLVTTSLFLLSGLVELSVSSYPPVLVPRA